MVLVLAGDSVFVSLCMLLFVCERVGELVRKCVGV